MRKTIHVHKAYSAHPQRKKNVGKQSSRDGPPRLFSSPLPGLLVSKRAIFRPKIQDMLEARAQVTQSIPQRKPNTIRQEIGDNHAARGFAGLEHSASRLKHSSIIFSLVAFAKTQPLKPYLTLHHILYNAFPKRTSHVRARRTQIFLQRRSTKTPQHIHDHTSNLSIPYHF